MILIAETTVTVKDIIQELDKCIADGISTDETTELYIGEHVTLNGSISELFRRLPDTMINIYILCNSNGETVDLSELKTKTKLDTLVLNCSDISQGSIKDLPKSITKLDLERCRLTSRDIQHLSLPNLKHLNLSGNRIHDMTEETIQSISSVKSLILKCTEFSSSTIITRFLENMPNLEYLSLDKSPVFGVLDTAAIEKHKSIKHIYLVDTYISRAPTNSPKIQYVDVPYSGDLDTIIGLDCTRVYILHDNGHLLIDIGAALQSISSPNDIHIDFCRGVHELKDSIVRLIKEEVEKVEESTHNTILKLQNRIKVLENENRKIIDMLKNLGSV